MAQPTTGQIVHKSQIPSFEDAAGNKINWEVKDGIYTADCEVPLAFDEKGKQQGSVKYTYTMTPDGNEFVITVGKEKIPAKEVLTAAEEKQAIDQTKKLEKVEKKSK